LHLALRLAFLTAALLVLLVMPFGEASVLLVLFVAVDLGAAALMLRDDTPAVPLPVAAIGGDVANLALLRRTVPELRMRRPAMTIEAQVRWRQQAERIRRSREMLF
jgi:hypothetical protein